MKQTSTRFLRRQVTSGNFDRKLGQITCFVAGMLVLVLGFWKLTRLDLNEAQLFSGVLLSLCVPLLLVVGGLMLPVAVNGGSPQT